jgi:hypothetical protein
MKLFLVLAAALSLLVIFSRDVTRDEAVVTKVDVKPTPVPVKMKGTLLDKPYNDDHCPHSGPINSGEFRSTMLDHKNTYNAPGTYTSPLDRRPNKR